MGISIIGALEEVKANLLIICQRSLWFSIYDLNSFQLLLVSQNSKINIRPARYGFLGYSVVIPMSYTKFMFTGDLSSQTNHIMSLDEDKEKGFHKNYNRIGSIDFSHDYQVYPSNAIIFTRNKDFICGTQEGEINLVSIK